MEHGTSNKYAAGYVTQPPCAGADSRLWSVDQGQGSEQPEAMQRSTCRHTNRHLDSCASSPWHCRTQTTKCLCCRLFFIRSSGFVVSSFPFSDMRASCLRLSALLFPRISLRTADLFCRLRRASALANASRRVRCEFCIISFSFNAALPHCRTRSIPRTWLEDATPKHTKLRRRMQANMSLPCRSRIDCTRAVSQFLLVLLLRRRLLLRSPPVIPYV